MNFALPEFNNTFGDFGYYKSEKDAKYIKHKDNSFGGYFHNVSVDMEEVLRRTSELPCKIRNL
ncbi:hypothetical protein [Wansuia hejianensis]|uniref:Uncharacterized protein n=1 Tax=Wansuia hejianensis TaxID=2763667 RepID=A0A926IP76_9FIRM|nr:hypothetical protein [Wansuia hejianensis]MBC8591388.1 hypothetical protein [Wansuia hejianensis]